MEDSTCRGGCWGKVLFVDVGTGEQRARSRSTADAARRLPRRPRPRRLLPLQACCRPATDPLSPDNPLIFTVGSAVAAPARPAGARAAVVTKSPQTGLYLFCITGGELGPGDQALRLRRDRPDRPVRAAGLRGGRRRQGQAARRGAPLGARHAGHAGVHPRGAAARRARDHLHRPGGRAPGPVRLPAQRAPRPRPRRRRRRHGLQERQGAGRARRHRGRARRRSATGFKTAVREDQQGAARRTPSPRVP